MAGAAVDMVRHGPRGLRLWYRLPWPVRFLAVVAAWFTYGVVLSNLNADDDSLRSAQIIWGVTEVGAALTALIDAIRPAAFGSVDELLCYAGALRTGILPEGVDITLWRFRIRRSRAANAVAPLLGCPVIGLAMLMADSSLSPYRVPVLWVSMGCGIALFAAWCRRRASVRQLNSAIDTRRRSEQEVGEPSEPATAPGDEDSWRSLADASLTARFVTVLVMTGILAFLVLAVADLDSIVYGPGRAAHLGLAAVCATATGLITTVIAFQNPRLTVTDRTVGQIMQYDLAFRTGDLPDVVDVDRWRTWTRGHRHSAAVLPTWAVFLLIVGGWSLANHHTGFDMILTALLGVLAAGCSQRWRKLCSRLAWLDDRLRQQAVRRSYG